MLETNGVRPPSPPPPSPAFENLEGNWLAATGNQMPEKVELGQVKQVCPWGKKNGGGGVGKQKPSQVVKTL